MTAELKKKQNRKTERKKIGCMHFMFDSHQVLQAPLSSKSMVEWFEITNYQGHDANDIKLTSLLKLRGISFHPIVTSIQ